MTDIDCFNLLSSLEMNLYQPGIEDSFNNNELNQFKNYRSNYKNQVDRVRNHAASILLDKLQQNESSLKNGITKLESTINHIEDQINFLSTLNNVVGLVATIVKVVA
jgi:hypothetical protein